MLGTDFSLLEGSIYCEWLNFRGFSGGSYPWIPVPAKEQFSVWFMKENIKSINFYPNGYALSVQSTKIGAHEIKPSTESKYFSSHKIAIFCILLMIQNTRHIVFNQMNRLLLFNLLKLEPSKIKHSICSETVCSFMNKAHIRAVLYLNHITWKDTLISQKSAYNIVVKYKFCNREVFPYEMHINTYHEFRYPSQSQS